MHFDWKYSLALVAAIAGVAVPVMLWQFDLKAKSINVKLIASAELQSPAASYLPNLKILNDGIIISSPVFSIVEISNDGSKPISTADFESPLEISVNDDSKLIQVGIFSAEPKNLKPELEIKNQIILIKPLLLNPNDKLIISILSSGKRPVISANARILGISLINFSNEIKTTSNYSNILRIVFSVIGLGLVNVYIAAFTFYKSNKITKIVLLTTCISFAALSMNALVQTLNFYSIFFSGTTIWIFNLFLLVLWAPITYYSHKWFHRESY